MESDERLDQSQPTPGSGNLAATSILNPAFFDWPAMLNLPLFTRHSRLATQVEARTKADSSHSRTGLPWRLFVRVTAGLHRVLHGHSDSPQPHDHPPVAIYLALFLAFVMAMFGAAALISQRLPLFILEL